MADKIKLLIADDNPVIRSDLFRYFKTLDDIEVCCLAADGKAALEGIREHEPDVVLLDIIMTRMDGLDVLMALRDDVKKPRVIMIAAIGLEMIARNAMQVGADFYVLKPLDLDFLTAKIRILAQTKLVGTRERETTVSLDRRIRQKLMDIGIPTHTVGYKYLVDALVLYIETGGTISATKHLYPMIADKYKTSAASVERGIRNTFAIYASISKKFGNRHFEEMHLDRQKMANMAMISYLAEMIRLEMDI